MRVVVRLMGGLLALAGFTLLVIAPARTQEEPGPERVPDKVRHAPTAMPDRVVLTWKGDPATSQAVTWRTDASVRRAMAEIAVAEGGPKFVRKLSRLPATTEALQTDLSLAHFHSIDFQGLQPKTSYVYRLGDGVNWSEWYQFTTAAASAEPFSFIYFGDVQNDIKAHWSRVIRQAFRSAPQARFLLHAGDLVNTAGRDAEWGEWFGAAGWINGTVPCLPTPGNHEYLARRTRQPDGTEKFERFLAPHWRPQFTLPENGPEELRETCYYLDLQGTRFISLNSNERIAEQTAWLERVLDTNPQRWTIVTHHHPVFSGAKDRDNAIIRQEWKPLFDRHRVDLVLQGHDHLYTRTGLAVPEVNTRSGVNAQAQEAGTVYVVSVSGPKMYNLDRVDYYRRAGEDTQLYQVIHLDGDTLRYRAHTATGELYDAFTLRKQPGKRNELIDEIPATAEVRRPLPSAPKKP